MLAAVQAEECAGSLLYGAAYDARCARWVRIEHLRHYRDGIGSLEHRLGLEFGARTILGLQQRPLTTPRAICGGGLDTWSRLEM
jgi:hypothetical protein